MGVLSCPRSSHSHFSMFQPFMWVFASITQTITVWMVLLVTIDRYIAICKPLQLHLRSVERARLAVVIIIVSAVLYNVPRAFERKIEHSQDPCTGRLVAKVTDSRWC